MRNWSPDVISGLFLDNEDENGLLFWYEDILAVDAEIKAERAAQAKKNRRK